VTHRTLVAILVAFPWSLAALAAASCAGSDPEPPDIILSKEYLPACGPARNGETILWIDHDRALETRVLR